MAPEPPDYFLPETGLVLSHLLIVRDVDRSREFYQGVLGADVVRERNPCVLRFYNGYIVINGEGGPTDDKPDVQASAPPDSRTLSSAMNIRVTDIQPCFTSGVHGVQPSSQSRRSTPSKPVATCETRTAT